MGVGYIKQIFGREDARVMIIGIITGGLIQVFCKRCLKNHLEFSGYLSQSQSAEEFPCGLTFLAKHGLLAGVISSLVIVGKKIPVTAIN